MLQLLTQKSNWALSGEPSADAIAQIALPDVTENQAYTLDVSQISYPSSALLAWLLHLKQFVRSKHATLRITKSTDALHRLTSLYALQDLLDNAD